MEKRNGHIILVGGRDRRYALWGTRKVGAQHTAGHIERQTRSARRRLYEVAASSLTARGLEVVQYVPDVTPYDNSMSGRHVDLAQTVVDDSMRTAEIELDLIHTSEVLYGLSCIAQLSQVRAARSGLRPSVAQGMLDQVASQPTLE